MNHGRDTAPHLALKSVSVPSSVMRRQSPLMHATDSGSAVLHPYRSLTISLPGVRSSLVLADLNDELLPHSAPCMRAAPSASQDARAIQCLCRSTREGPLCHAVATPGGAAQPHDCSSLAFGDERTSSVQKSPGATCCCTSIARVHPVTSQKPCLSRRGLLMGLNRQMTAAGVPVPTGSPPQRPCSSLSRLHAVRPAAQSPATMLVGELLCLSCRSHPAGVCAASSWWEQHLMGLLRHQGQSLLPDTCSCHSLYAAMRLCRSLVNALQH